MKGYIPSNLILGAERHSDKYFYILTSLYYGKIFDKRNEASSFIPLNGKVLQSVIGGRYKNYLNHLLDKGIIETDNWYLVGKKSKGYRFTNEFRDVKFRRITIMDENIIRNVEKFKEYQVRGIILPQHKYIYDCLNKVSIKEDKARNFIERYTTKAEQYNSYSISVDLIVSQNYFFVADSTAGRVHNNITNLSSDLRKFLRYENQELVEIDIRNSQPFLFNLLIQDYLNTYTYPLSDLYLSYGNQSLISYPDIELYKELTSKGIFYEYIIPFFPTTSREKFKKKVFSRIFYNDEKKYQYEEWFTFQDIFPNVAQIISYYKKDDYKNLAITLQRAEAEIIINRIVPKLADKKIFALTIHDSILTTAENSETVKKIILDEFKSQYGLIPTIKIK
jgi:hypothetical protein